MALKWIGHTKGAEGLPNIPARDLSNNEADRYGGEKALLATGLYIKPDPPRETKSKTVDPLADAE